MPLDRRKRSALIDKIMNVFSITFGNDVFLVEKQVAIEHMGFFKIKYRYIPFEYDIVFENDRGVFSIDIYDNEGAHNILYRIERFDHETTIENVKNATLILKDVLKKNDFYFYITKEGKLYRKKNQQYKRVKNLCELMGDSKSETKE